METVCSNCGERNSPETQFCSYCGSYLGWQDSATRRRTPAEGAALAPDPPAPATAGPTDTQPIPARGPADERAAFDASVVSADATVPIDGTPVTVTVKVSNTSTVVDSYVVEAVETQPWLVVQPGRVELLPSSEGAITTVLRVDSPTLMPAQELAVRLRVRNTTAEAVHRDLWLRVTVPVVDGPLTLRAEPRLLRTRDAEPGVCSLVVDNSRSNRWSRVRLSASDPEQVVRASWGSPELQVPPGGSAETKLRLDAPPPDAGAETSRTITITAADGQRSAETNVTFTQSAARNAMETVALRLDPTVLRLGGRTQGQLNAVVDNRSGSSPVRVTLSGDDPENRLRFAFAATTVDVAPGRQVAVLVTVTAPRTPPSQEVTRPMSVVASDGRTEVRGEGSVIQLAPSRRGLARIVFTVLGAVLMIAGALLPFVSDSDDTGVDLSAQTIAHEVDASNPDLGIPNQLNAGGVENVVSVGLLLFILAALVVFGLTSQTGKLTRVAAILGAVVVVATFIGSATLADGSGPGSGALVAFAGCVSAYVGGLLARR